MSYSILLTCNYCKFGNFCEDFIFGETWHMQSFVKIKPSRNGKIALLFIDIGKSCISHEFFTSLICLLMLFAKIKLSQKFLNLQYMEYQGSFGRAIKFVSKSC